MITDEWTEQINELNKLRSELRKLTSHVATLSDEVWRLSTSQQNKGIVVGLAIGFVFGAASLCGIVLIVLK